MQSPAAALARPLIPEIRGLIETEKNPEERVGILLLLARCLQKMGDTDDARKTLGDAVARARKLPAAELSPLLLPSVAFDAHKLGDAATARALLAEAMGRARAQKEVQKRFYSLGFLAQMQGQLGDKTGALVALAALRKLDPKQASSDEGLWLESFTRASAGDLVGGLKAAAGVKDPGRRGSLLAQLSTRQRKAGDRAGAAASMAKARTLLAQEKNPALRELNQGLALAELVAQGEGAAAVRLAGKSESLRKDVADALLVRGQRSAALALKPAPTPNLVYSHAAAGDIAAAQATMEKTLAAHGFSMQDDPIRMLGAIAAAQAKAGDAAGAGANLEEAQKKARTPDDVFGDRSAALLASLLESVVFGGWRRRED